jgi:hypothetical protein
VRLTLRTLLAYLDDTLEPSQAKLIGQKVAESDTAQELIARIKQVTRRRRLTVPPATGPGSKLDPNTAAEYLDNTLDPDQLAEVEQICLSSDVHLAEIAACHQILTLVLGEPVLIPPSSRQRMYGLVKGPEAVPFRRPAAAGEAEPVVEPNYSPETDETLRLGLPAYRQRGSWSSRLAVIGGGVAAALLLALAIWQALRIPGAGDDDADDTARQAQATAPAKKDTPAAPATEKDTAKTGKEGSTGQTGNGGDGKQTGKGGKETGKSTGKDMGNGTGSTTNKGTQGEKVPPDQASKVVRVAGAYVPDAVKPSLLAQKVPKGAWKLLSAGDTKVLTGTPLVALPGFRGVVQTAGGVKLTLWGALREEMFFPPVQESVVQLNDNPAFGADLTLKRGRVFLANPGAKPVSVRLRFENPTNPEKLESWDVTLEEPNTEVLVDRWTYFLRGEPFYEDPNNADRQGPTAALHLLVLKGAVQLRREFQSVRMVPPPGVALVTWNSIEGQLKEPMPLPSVPDFATEKPRLPPGASKEALEAFQNARDDAYTNLAGRGERLESALVSLRKSPNPIDRVMAVRCFAALDDVPELLDALGDNEERPELRLSAIQALRDWVTTSRDADYVVQKELRGKYSGPESVNIMTLLHSFSEKDAQKAGTYGLLIDYLGSDKIAIRELAYWHLARLAPQAAQSVRYIAAAPPEQRDRAQREWTKLLTSGKLPPRPMPAPGG